MRRVPTNTATSPGGTLPGPGPLRHQPRRITLTVDALPDGRLRVSTSGARGWAAVARGPHQLAHAVGRAFTEEAVAAYSAWRRQRYDLDTLTERDDPTEPPRREIGRPRPVDGSRVSYGKDRVVRPDQASPEDWTPNRDGSWRSPNGKRFTSPKYVGPLVRRRRELGLSTSYEQHEAIEAQRRRKESA